MTHPLTAETFVKRLTDLHSPEELKKIQRYFKSGEGDYGEGDTFLGVRMGQVFALAKEYIDLPCHEIECLLESPIHEVRAGGMSVMDKRARRRSTSEQSRKELYDLYLRRHDRINNWDLVDVAAPHVVGGYLFDKPRSVLWELARSKNLWERRTAMVSTFYFVSKGDVHDTFLLAEVLVDDSEDLMHKAVGGGLRYAGTRAPAQLREFLDRFAHSMPRTMLRVAIEHLEKGDRDHYLGLAKAKPKST